MTGTDRLVGLRRQLHDDRAVLLAAFERVPAARRAERPAAGRWSASEVVSHVAIVEGRLAAALLAVVPGLPPAAAGAPVTPYDITPLLNRTSRFQAPEFVHPKGHVDAAVALAAVTQAWADVDAVLTAAEGADLAAWTRPHPALGPLDGYQWLWSLGGHARRHAAQLDEIAAALTGA